MEKTVQLWMAREGEAALEIHGNTVLLETFSRDMDGIFPSEEDWEEFSEDLDAQGVWYMGQKKLLGDDVTYTGQYVDYRFPEPIKVVTGFQIKDGERRDVISDVTYIRFLVNIQWLWLRSESDKRRAGMVEIEGTFVTCG